MDDLTLESVDEEGIDGLIEVIHQGFDAVSLPPGVDPFRSVPFAFTLRNDRGEIEGAVTGHSVWGWLYVHYLWVSDRWRGRDQGTRLMQAAEEQAEKRGCTGIWLSTYSFQAAAFYQKLGYLECGRIHDFPEGHTRVFYQNHLTSMSNRNKV
ncbi:MAG: GNAT family N-acetyltransferase [Pseudomonadota bacterium]